MIPANLLNKLAHQLASVLTLLFQVSLDQGQLPEDLKIADIILVYKKRSRSCSSNYKLISLTCICCKIMEHIVYSNVLQHFQEHNVLCEEQHSFRSGRSYETQLLNTINDFSKNLDMGRQTDVVQQGF